MLGRSALKISFFITATCTVILAFIVTGEMVLRWLKPSEGSSRLKLEIVASVDVPKPESPDAPVAGAPTPATAILAPGPAGPFDAVVGRSAGSSANSLAYLEPPGARSALPVVPPAAQPGVTAAAPEPQTANERDAPATTASLRAPQPGAKDVPSADAAQPIRDPHRAIFKIAMEAPVSPKQPGQSLRILQIGDSHTAADFFTGDVRQRLQATYGDGGAGYLVVGKPNPGVRSEILKMAASNGWAYTAIQKSDDSSQFHLSGFNAIAGRPGETLTLSTDAPISFDSIDIEVRHGPDSGAVELRFDNDQAVRFDLKGSKPEWWFLRATSQRDRVEQLRQLSITTLDAKPVDVSSVAIFNQRYGVSYSAIGFPGATIDIVNRFPEEFFTDDLQHINPQIVVLAFGTNEGFNDDLDVAKYGERFTMAVKRVRAALPSAQIVLVGPPNANRLPHVCRTAVATSCRAGASVVHSSEVSDGAQACVWQTPPKLDRVREMQRIVARQEHILYWNWADVMPPDCGAHQWAVATPRLVQPDHVHFTAEGYRLGALKFSEFLLPIIEKLRLTDRVVSNN